MSRKQELAVLLAELFEVVRDETDNQEGRDFAGLDCGNCIAGVPMAHSLGCRIMGALAGAKLDAEREANRAALAPVGGGAL
jgi:hypothetical protein